MSFFRRVSGALYGFMARKRNVLLYVMGHESGSGDSAYLALNRNTDGAGLSVGIIQWAQRPGGLGVLLASLHRAGGGLAAGG